MRKVKLTPLDKHFYDQKALSIIKHLNNFPIEVLIIKHLVKDCDLKSEEELVALLKTVNTPEISQVMKVKLQNGYRDVFVSKIYKLDKIPNIFK